MESAVTNVTCLFPLVAFANTKRSEIDIKTGSNEILRLASVLIALPALFLILTEYSPICEVSALLIVSEL